MQSCFHFTTHRIFKVLHNLRLGNFCAADFNRINSQWFSVSILFSSLINYPLDFYPIVCSVSAHLPLPQFCLLLTETTLAPLLCPLWIIQFPVYLETSTFKIFTCLSSHHFWLKTNKTWYSFVLHDLLQEWRWFYHFIKSVK